MKRMIAGKFQGPALIVLSCAVLCACGGVETTGQGGGATRENATPAGGGAATGTGAGAVTNLETGDAKVRVKATGFRSDKGKALIRLFSGAEGFPGNAGKAFMKVEVPISNGTAETEFAGLKPGAYAVSIAHDEDGNGRMTYNFLNIPVEGSGVSGKPQSGMPRFAESTFEVAAGEEVELNIPIRYHK